MNSTTRTALWLSGAVPLAASILTGCGVSTETAKYEPVPPAVVVTPPPAVVTAPAPAPPRPAVVVPAPADRVAYPEGRYVLYNDPATGPYWGWVPAGMIAATPPAPPPLPAIAQSGATVITAPNRVMTYASGRYELYGDANTGYYWVWMPERTVAPAPPPRPPRLTEGR